MPPGNGGNPGAASARGASRRRWLRRQCHAQLSAARCSQPFFGRLHTLAIQCQAVREKIPFVQRHEDTFEAAIGGLLGAQHHPGLAARRTSKRREQSDVLIGLVRQQPAARGSRGRADDLAVLGAPGALSNRLPPGEARAGEDGVRREVLRRAMNDGGKSGRHDRRRRERRSQSIRHDSSPDSSGAGRPGSCGSPFLRLERLLLPGPRAATPQAPRCLSLIHI